MEGFKMPDIMATPIESPESYDEETVIVPRFFSDSGVGKEILEEILERIKKIEKDMEELKK